MEFEAELQGAAFQGYCTGDVEDAGAVAVRVVADSAPVPSAASGAGLGGSTDGIQVGGCGAYCVIL